MHMQRENERQLRAAIEVAETKLADEPTVRLKASTLKREVAEIPHPITQRSIRGEKPVNEQLTGGQPVAPPVFEKQQLTQWSEGEMYVSSRDMTDGFGEELGLANELQLTMPEVEIGAEVVEFNEWGNVLLPAEYAGLAEYQTVAEAKPPAIDALLAEDAGEVLESQVVLIEPEQAVREALPETVLQRLEVYSETAAPEAVEIVESLVSYITMAANHLHELSVTERVDSEEAVQIEALVIKWYEELCEQLGIVAEAEELAIFIANIRAESYAQTLPEETVAEADRGTHERKLDVFTIPQSLHTISQKLHDELGRFIVRAAAVGSF